MNIASDPDNLWSDSHGILVAGKNASITYPYKGANFWKNWEVPAYVEVFASPGSPSCPRDARSGVFGAYSRANDAKCLALMARSQYGAESFAAAIFPDLPYANTSRWCFATARRKGTLQMRDVLITSLVGRHHRSGRAGFPAGGAVPHAEYYGVYYFREKLNKHYIAQHYGVDPNPSTSWWGNSLGADGQQRRL